ncbi:MAG TPA: hypothetical protein VG841_07070 [Caulobacterales bacterium]|nr:hypothetical protein [Caulobacterales bacterium]
MSVTLAPAALWRIAHSFLATLIALFGTPDELAGRLLLTRREHKLACAWLRTGEAMLRRLIFIEARAYAKPNTPLPTPNTSAPRTLRPRAPHSFKLDATFHVITGAPRKSTRRTRRALRDAPRLDYVSAGGAAGRFAALVRAFNDPAAYARRLARRLFADGKRAFVLLRALAPIGQGHGEDWEAAEAGATAEALAHFVNSS